MHRSIRDLLFIVVGFLVSAGLVDLKPLITHTLALDQWETAFELITARKSEAIKVEFAC